MTREEKMKRIAKRFVEQSQVAIHNNDGSITVLSLENGLEDEFNPMMFEYPFVYVGMTLEEYREEHDYYWQHIKDVHNRTYKPLWKQRGETHPT